MEVKGRRRSWQMRATILRRMAASELEYLFERSAKTQPEITAPHTPLNSGRQTLFSHPAAFTDRPTVWLFPVGLPEPRSLAVECNADFRALAVSWEPRCERETRRGRVSKRSIVSGYRATSSTNVAASGLTWPPCSHFSTVRGLTRSMFAHTARETLNFSRAATKNSAPGDTLIFGAETVCVRRVTFPSR